MSVVFYKYRERLRLSRGIEVAKKDNQIMVNKIFFIGSKKLSNSFLTVVFIFLHKIIVFWKKVSKTSKGDTLIINEETFF